ncbi:hypothetical protein JHK85_025077 [Glycine max]|nr:hypothetical protein JHK85_025077 [Glycine max]
MAFLRSTLATSMVLLAMLSIASATDYYGYGPTPKLENPKPKTDYKFDDKPHPTKPDYYAMPKSKGNDELHLLPTIIGVQGVVLRKTYSDQINSRDHHIEKPTASDVHKYAGELEIGRRCFLDKVNMNEDEETYRHYDAELD